VEHYENLGVPLVTTHLQQPKYFQINGKYFLTLKVICPAYAVTLATEKPLVEEDTLLQGGIIEASDVELKDICFTDVNDYFLHSVAI
jgi:flagella basal body P-ring formation protein FlgA